MTVSDMLTWIVGIGALLYFGAAMLKPAWFLGDDNEPAPPTKAEEEKRWANLIEQDDWQHLGQSR